ncbi:hypothetical protein [uncultured Mediterranean phage uvMED]|nr:hypothetical protein [uncultured Mediterranean phage uvMED]
MPSNSDETQMRLARLALAIRQELGLKVAFQPLDIISQRFAAKFVLQNESYAASAKATSSH